MGHARLKNLNEKGAKLLNLVPGAGLEPARTLPGPRDFKSANYSRYQQLTCRKVQYQRGFPTGAVSFCSFQHSSLVTAIVTVKVTAEGAKPTRFNRHGRLSAAMNDSSKIRTGERVASGLLIPCGFTSNKDSKAFCAV